MMSTTGKINVQTENIFPVIKKFLYSDHEIFLRELVSNAVDATQKIKTLSSLGEFKGELGDLTIQVTVDKEKNTLTISDKGVGMTSEEIEKYINQIAFSGAEEFVNKYKEQADGQLIGKFGLGFYSAFMVATHVEISTLSFREGAEAVKWSCDGSPQYTIETGTRTERGTDIVLTLDSDSLEFLESARIKTLLDKYCRFLPVEISFEGEIINNTKPAWTKKPAELTDEDYRKFYAELYPAAGEPLFYIHLNVDYPFNLTGILYFPKLKNNLEVQKNKIKLFSRQVFITDAVEGIVPEFLTLLNGVLDSPDIPLNVSRSYLQSDANVKKISNHILKKVSDKLEELFKENRTDFEAKWDDISVFIKYGMLSEEKFYDRAKNFCLLKNTDAKYFTLEEYKSLISAAQTDKDNKVVYLYTSNKEDQHMYIQSATAKGYDVLQMEEVIDPHFVNFLEHKIENSSFVRVDSETTDKLIRKDISNVSKLNADQEKQLKEMAEEIAGKEQFSVQLEPLGEEDAPVMVTRPEFMRRMKEMSAAGGGFGFASQLGDFYNLVVNVNHPVMSKILLETDEAKRRDGLKQAIDLGLLAQGLLKGEALAAFLKRSASLI
jgi:molecular chaperone HtpG